MACSLVCLAQKITEEGAQRRPKPQFSCKGVRTCIVWNPWWVGGDKDPPNGPGAMIVVAWLRDVLLLYSASAACSTGELAAAGGCLPERWPRCGAVGDSEPLRTGHAGLGEGESPELLPSPPWFGLPTAVNSTVHEPLSEQLPFAARLDFRMLRRPGWWYDSSITGGMYLGDAPNRWGGELPSKCEFSFWGDAGDRGMRRAALRPGGDSPSACGDAPSGGRLEVCSVVLRHGFCHCELCRRSCFSRCISGEAA
jgi:hypothetical protein